MNQLFFLLSLVHVVSANTDLTDHEKSEQQILAQLAQQSDQDLVYITPSIADIFMAHEAELKSPECAQVLTQLRAGYLFAESETVKKALVEVKRTCVSANKKAVKKINRYLKSVSSEYERIHPVKNSQGIAVPNQSYASNLLVLNSLTVQGNTKITGNLQVSGLLNGMRISGPSAATATQRFSYIYAFNAGTGQTIASGAPVVFNNQGLNFALSLSTDGTIFTASQSGIYRLSFIVYSSTTAGLDFAVKVNGVALTGSEYVSPATTLNGNGLTGQTIVSLSLGATLQILNNASTAVTLLGSSANTVNASVLIEQIA